MYPPPPSLPRMGDSVETKVRPRYYDHSATINNAVPNPITAEDSLYNKEEIYKYTRRNADRLWVVNDGKYNLYIRFSSGAEGIESFSDENVIYSGDYKIYYNVFELRLRSPVAGLSYRVSENEIQRGCCPASVAAPTNSSVTNPTWIHSTEVIAPGAGTTLLSRTVSVGKSGYIYGFLISAQESNDFLINWISGAISESIRIVFGTRGSSQDTELIPLNIGLSADANTNITIVNVNAGSAGTIYQARLLYAEI